MPSLIMIADVPQWLILSAVIVVVFLFKAKQCRLTSAKLPLPPSPPGYPVIGNILDVPTRDMEAAFRDINAKYGANLFMLQVWLDYSNVKL